MINNFGKTYKWEVQKAYCESRQNGTKLYIYTRGEINVG